jgi:hypothetical protein
MRTFVVGKFTIGFDTLKSGMCQTIVTDSTNLLPIYLLFEPDKIDAIERKMKAVTFKKGATLEFFKMVVAGCIRTCMRD